MTNVEYKNQWNREHLDRVILTMKKGKKPLIVFAAKKQGLSVNGYINKLIDEDLEKNPVE